MIAKPGPVALKMDIFSPLRMYVYEIQVKVSIMVTFYHFICVGYHYSDCYGIAYHQNIS